jgi:uncharacterized protein (DUF488 family)
VPEEGIAYIHMPELGGRRKPAADSPNTFWRNEQFRGYADHMATEEFRSGIERLLAFPERTAVMCAEAVPWKCHRNLLADDLTRRGVEVVHILGTGSRDEHTMNQHARVEGGRVIYPGSYNLPLIP